MIKARYASLLLLLALVACSSDDDDDSSASDAGSEQLPDESSSSTYQFIFTNLSTSQPMTPPIAVIHDLEITFFEEGETASPEIVAIAQNGELSPLRDDLLGRVLNGVASFGSPVNDDLSDGLLMPGGSATLTLTSDSSTQVLSVVSMIVCSNDGFTGFNSRPLNAGVETTTALNYDAGSEINTLSRDYWVDPCGGTGNLHEDENGTITVHQGQQPTGDDAERAFEAGAELLQVQITRN